MTGRPNPSHQSSSPDANGREGDRGAGSWGVDLPGNKCQGKASPRANSQGMGGVDLGTKSAPARAEWNERVVSRSPTNNPSREGDTVIMSLPAPDLAGSTQGGG